MVKHDIVLWPAHAKEQGTEALFPNGGSLKITHNGKTEVVEFVPMAGGKGLKPVKSGTLWGSIKYGTEVRSEVVKA